MRQGIRFRRLIDLDYIESIAIHPADAGLAYITTETEGLWTRNNFNMPTPMLQRDPTYPFRQPVRVLFNPFDANEVWVTSFGGGLCVGHSAAPVEMPMFANGFK